MSGHSHARTIMHKKGLTDAKRSQIFSKLAGELAIAAKEGPNAETNPRLRTVIEKAREANMPTENIERAIKKAAGEGAGQLEEIILEAYGPGGIAVLIASITDNKNRAIGDIKQILNTHQGKLVEGGAVRWLFEQKGIITAVPQEHVSLKKEDVELAVIEAGAQDLHWHNGVLDIFTNPAQLEEVRQNIQTRGIPIESASLGWVPKEYVEIGEEEKKKTEELFEALEENDAVQEIYSNLKW